MKWKITFLIILSVTIYNNAIEYLVGENYQSSVIMIYRGMIAFGVCTFISIYKGYSLFPSSWQPQIWRLITNGISALMFIMSFKYLSASTVSLISRLDLPFLILLSLLLGESKSSLQFWLSIWTISTIIFLTLDARFINEEPVGFLYAIGSVLLVSFGYLIVKKSAERENVFLICNIYNVSSILFGIAVLSFRNDALFIHNKDIWIFLISGLSQVAIYTLTIPLYKLYSVERTRLPFIIAIIATMICEMLIERKLFGFSQIGLTFLITGMLITISLNSETPKKMGFLRRRNNSNAPKDE